MALDDVTFFVPFHSNWEDIERLAPFIGALGGTVFMYSFNPDGMRDADTIAVFIYFFPSC